jgi:hypothetical protein
MNFPDHPWLHLCNKLNFAPNPINEHLEEKDFSNWIFDLKNSIPG